MISSVAEDREDEEGRDSISIQDSSERRLVGASIDLRGAILGVLIAKSPRLYSALLLVTAGSRASIGAPWYATGQLPRATVYGISTRMYARQ